MTHDPMCPNGDPRVQAAVEAAAHSVGAELSGWCQFCPVIARVREDERNGIGQEEVYFAGKRNQ